MQIRVLQENRFFTVLPIFFIEQAELLRGIESENASFLADFFEYSRDFYLMAKQIIKTKAMVFQKSKQQN